MLDRLRLRLFIWMNQRRCPHDKTAYVCYRSTSFVDDGVMLRTTICSHCAKTLEAAKPI